jgi:hypothetical protein
LTRFLRNDGNHLQDHMTSRPEVTTSRAWSALFGEVYDSLKYHSTKWKWVYTLSSGMLIPVVFSMHVNVSATSVIGPEHGGSILLRNPGTQPKCYWAQQPRTSQIQLYHRENLRSYRCDFSSQYVTVIDTWTALAKQHCHCDVVHPCDNGSLSPVPAGRHADPSPIQCSVPFTFPIHSPLRLPLPVPPSLPLVFTKLFSLSIPVVFIQSTLARSQSYWKTALKWCILLDGVHAFPKCVLTYFA